MAPSSPDVQGRITVDPGILVGKPVVTGTRIPVYLILNLIAHGYDFAQIIEDYPCLQHDDIKAALLYAAKVMDRPVTPPAPVAQW